eukprot:TRINITY_DN5720_c7_g1_i1.p1 TRINITY_DN5720_c7_g1~~TRINITY_DN5720_c7_g1_i1.p1  ORF type:complete len:346 (+),score=76.84 TRINITY_DN5720_c7_g1_i1:49-1038(+)
MMPHMSVTHPAMPRWSADRKHSPAVPVYVPPELFTVCKGQAMGVFMLRAAFADMNRIGEQKREDEWYLRKRKRDEAPVYNAKGERVNTAQMVFKEKKMKLVQELLAVSSRINQKNAQSEARITKKIYFTKEQIQSRAYGAILGARGRTHQELQQSTGCKISLMGKGISDMLKNKQNPGEHRAGEDDAPHCHITAPSEEALHKCVERIEFIISDRKEAIEFRNEKRKEVAILNGTYREETWKQGAAQQPGVFNPMAAAPQRNTASADAEYMRFMSELEGNAPPPPPPGMPGTYGAPPPMAGAPPGMPGGHTVPPPPGMMPGQGQQYVGPR